jgi:hypothetical protein
VIFTALGLLVLAGALLLAGIAKSSVLLLMLSLLSTVAAAAVLALTYSIARRTGLTTGALPAMPAPAAGAPPTMPPDVNTATVVMYVPVDQLPAMAPAAAAMKVGGGANGNGTGAGGGASAPVSGYDDMTAEQVVKLVTSGALNEMQLTAVREYEASHGARKSVLDRIDKVLYRA